MRRPPTLLMPSLALWLGSMAAPALADGLKSYDRVVDLGQQQYTYITDSPKLDEAGNLISPLDKPSSGGGYQLEAIDPNRSGHFLGTTLHKIGDTTNLLPAALSSQVGGFVSPNASGHIAGNLATTDSSGLFFFAPETGQLSWLKYYQPGGTGATGVNGINALDQLVGEQDNKAVLWASPTSVPVELSSLLPSSTGWKFILASDINDRGEIIGYGINPSGQVSDFKLEPSAVPEPSTLAVFAVLGAAAMGFRHRLRR